MLQSCWCTVELWERGSWKSSWKSSWRNSGCHDDSQAVICDIRRLFSGSRFQEVAVVRRDADVV
jgi:hypothetical protein